jgi:Zn-dependent protease with chaperone function
VDFFAQQAKARGQSKRLIVLFAIAVLLIVGAVTTIAVVSYDIASADQHGRGVALTGSPFSRHPVAVFWCVLLTLAVIGIASMVKTARLRGGGGVVARALGGTLVPTQTKSYAHRRLRNVVEEIAIASGVPVPEIYVLEKESGINAFAAGFAPADAAVAVTQGALERLTRDELQGVVAHEFSHILNGDMRLNIRLMGVLFGILVIGIAGREIASNVRGGSDSKGAAAAVMFGLAIMIIGYAGLFFGRLIKASVSRQREYLADASAVQFTRQAGGIAGALKKIGALAEGSKLNANGEEVSHMLFGDGVGYSALFATHPPLVERIRRIEGNFDPVEFNTLAKRMAERHSAEDVAQAEATGPDVADLGAMGFASAARAASTQEVAVTPALVVGQVANPSEDDYRTAGAIARTLPDDLREQAYDGDGAQALVLALALDTRAAMQAPQLEIIQGSLGGSLRARVEALVARVARIKPMQRLPLAAVAFPALRRLPRAQVHTFAQSLNAVVHADGQVGLGEYCLAKLVATQVVEALDPSAAKVIGRRRLHQCQNHVAALFAVLARAGQPDEQAAQRAFQAGLTQTLPTQTIPYAFPADWLDTLDAAFAELDRLDGHGKQLLIGGLVSTMSHDNHISVAEAELLRTVCAALHCPLPPMLAVAERVA